MLWQTLPGQGFVAAAHGSETVAEARGMFFFHDRRSAICTDQLIEAFALEAGAAVLHRRLRCSNGATIWRRLASV